MILYREPVIAGIPIRTITAEVTHRCTRRCSFCYVSKPRESELPDELSAKEMAQRIGRLVEDTGCRHVQLGGGEPLLREDLAELVDALRRPGLRISLITDGGPLDEDLAKTLAARGVGPIQPTLLAGSADEHDALRGAGAFRETTRAIARAVKAGLPVIVSMVITKRNWSQAAAVADLAFALGARSLTLARFCSAGAAAGARERLMPTAVQVYAAAQAAAVACRARGLKLTAAITVPRCVWPDPDNPPLSTGVCSLVGPGTTVTVGPDGSVRTCALSTRTAGVLGEAPWEEIAARLWDEELRPPRETVPELCRDCALYPRCLGGCRLSGLAAGGSFEAADPLAPLKAKG